MPFADQRFFNRQSSIVNRQLLILILLLLPLTACGRYKARKALQKIQYFAEILKREDLRAIGEDGFFKDNLTGNRDPEVRRWCAIALGRIADPRALPLLYGALHTGDAEVRAASAFAIGEIEDRELLDLRCSVPDPRAQLELFRLLDDSSISVRMRAIEALGKTGSRAEAADIVRRLERFSYSGSAFENAYLSAAITALSRLGDPASIPFLERLAGVRDPEIQRRALEARMRVQAGASGPQPANNAQNPDAASLSPCGMKASGEPEPESRFHHGCRLLCARGISQEQHDRANRNDPGHDRNRALPRRRPGHGRAFRGDGQTRGLQRYGVYKNRSV